MTLSRKRTAGFTLMELMIAAAVVGILAAIALPNYNNYILRNNRAVAKRVLSELVAKQETVYLRQRMYQGNFSALLGNAALSPNTVYVDRSGKFLPNASDPGVIYKIEFLASNSATFVSNAGFTATAAGSQTADSKCLRFDLRVNGEKLASDNVTDVSSSRQQPDCWER